MLIAKRNLIKKYRGAGCFDSLISAVTNSTVKEIASTVAKKAITNLGTKASEKIINKVFTPPAKSRAEINFEKRKVLDNVIARGKGFKRI